MSVIRNGYGSSTGDRGGAADAPDVAIRGERGEREIGRARPRPAARREIDAAGRIVAPGPSSTSHTHDDAGAHRDARTMAMKASQGVTTVVCGKIAARSGAPFDREGTPGSILRLIFPRPRAHSAADHRELHRQGRGGAAGAQRRLPDRPLDPAQ